MGAFSASERTLDALPLAPRPPRPGAAPSVLPPATQRSVLVVTDLTPAGTNAAWRGALVARDRGLPVHLLHVQPHGHDLARIDASLKEAAAQMEQRLHVRASAEAVRGPLVATVEAAAERTALVVLPAAGRARLLAWIAGSLAERLLRRVGLPLLVVRRVALTSYRRVLVPVELDADAVRLIAAARELSRDPRMKVLHVLDTDHEDTMSLADVHEAQVRMLRERRSRSSYQALNELIERADAHPRGTMASITFGHAATRLLEAERAAGAQLIVVGKRKRSLVADLCFGSVTQRLLGDARADILVLPLEQARERAQALDLQAR